MVRYTFRTPMDASGAQSRVITLGLGIASRRSTSTSGAVRLRRAVSPSRVSTPGRQVSVMDVASMVETTAVAGDPLTTPTRSESPAASLRTPRTCSDLESPRASVMDSAPSSLSSTSCGKRSGERAVNNRDSRGSHGGGGSGAPLGGTGCGFCTLPSRRVPSDAPPRVGARARRARAVPPSPVRRAWE